MIKAIAALTAAIRDLIAAIYALIDALKGPKLASITINFRLGDKDMAAAAVVHSDFTQPLVATFLPKAKDGSAVALDPTKTSLSLGTPNIVDAVLAPDAMSATFTNFRVGSTSVDLVATGQADDGSDVHGTGTITVLGAGVATIDISFNQPTG